MSQSERQSNSPKYQTEQHYESARITPPNSNREDVNLSRVCSVNFCETSIKSACMYLQDLETTTPQELFTLLTYNSSCNADSVNWESLKQAFYLAGCKRRTKRQRV